LHKDRQRKRGYNQAAEIALPISKALKIPLDLKSCQRARYTEAQAKLNKNSRTRNLTTAFVVNKASLRGYKHVALVDDVVTTGSTIRAVSCVLLAAGVESIDVWCVCRA
jgi:ComF family protein